MSACCPHRPLIRLKIFGDRSAAHEVAVNKLVAENLARKRCTWIVVADAARARAYSTIAGSRKATEVEGGSFDNAGLHAHARQTGTDRPGRTLDSTGSARHAEQPRVDPHRMEKVRFAQFIGEWLEEHHQQFDALVVVAPPQILGAMRKAYGAETAKRLASEVDKDLTKVPPSELQRRLVALVPHF